MNGPERRLAIEWLDEHVGMNLPREIRVGGATVRPTSFVLDALLRYPGLVAMLVEAEIPWL